MSIPSTVKAAYWILLIGIILDLVAAAFALSVGGANLGAGGISGPNGPASVSLVAVGIGLLIIAVVQLIVLRKVRAGKNWARITITILEVISLASAIINFGLFPLAASVIGLIAIVLLWLPASSPYFRQR